MYGADGRIGLHNDLVNDVTWRYEYTKDGSLTSAYADNGERFDYTYEPSTGKLLTATVSDGTTSKTTTYNYSDHTNGEDANLIESVVLPTGTVEYSYDGFYRASYDVNVNSTDILTTDYTFVDGKAAGSTTTLVESMTNAGSGWSDTLSYTYDKKGNIETISENGTQKAKYYYDALNQLIREDNAWLNKTIAYTYDKGGNILSVSEYAYTTASDISSLTATSTNAYTYGDANWKDKLTAYNGNAITYDAIGNPLSYYDGKTFTWQNGRQLASVSGTGLTASYKYNADGVRTSKTVNGVTTTYLLEGNNIIMQTNGTDTMWFHYDATGSPVSFELNGTPYFYVKNQQGDIVAITSASGNIVVEYVYDSWGKLVSITGSLASTVGVKNPLRYRGYYYDTGVGLYYVASRYYDSEVGRFISTDTTKILTVTLMGRTDKNLFAYCDNNPVMREDKCGQFWNIVAGAVIGGGLELAGQLLSGKSISEVNWAKVGVSVVSGGLTAAVGPAAGCIISGATDVAMDALDGNINSVGDAVKSFAFGTVKAAVSYGIGTTVGKATKSLTKIEKIGIIGKNGYPGIKYSYNKGQGRAIRSIELHPRHNGHGVHLQGNKWNPKTGTRSGVFFRKTLWR